MEIGGKVLVLQPTLLGFVTAYGRDALSHPSYLAREAYRDTFASLWKVHPFYLGMEVTESNFVSYASCDGDSVWHGPTLM